MKPDMAQIIYVLCALTSAICALLLGRAYRRTRLRVLFWSCFCFTCLAINNAILFFDLVVIPSIDYPFLIIARGVTSLVGLLGLIYGLIWDGEP